MNIIIGGTHGLGLEIVHRLQDKHENTFAIGRSYNQAEHGAGMAVDLTVPEQVEELSGYIRELGKGALTGFFWVAGYGYNGDFAKQPDAGKMAIANFAGVVPLAQTAWRKMIEDGNPANFVIVSSTTGERARDNEAVYAATKHAQVGFARSLGKESERLESLVKVALFMPGGMQTPFWDGDRPASFDDFLDPVKVADKIVSVTGGQIGLFYEETIERGSL